MKPRRSWETFTHIPTRTLRRKQDKALARYLREELYALSPYYRRILDEAGVDVRRVRGVADLASLPFTEPADLAPGANPMLLTPAAHAIREHWGFSRKLALVLGGSRAGKALRRGYERAPRITEDSDLHASGCTVHDLDLLAEVGFRAALQMGIESQTLEVSRTWTEPADAFTLTKALLAGARQPQGSGKLLDLQNAESSGTGTAPEPAPPLAVLVRANSGSTPARESTDRLAQRTHAGWLVVVGTETISHDEASIWANRAPAAHVLRVHARPDLPMAFFEAPRSMSDWAEDPSAGPGFIVHPDLCILEVIDPVTLQPVAEGQPGEVVYTSLVAHGRALLRYRTGDWAPRGLTWPARGESASGYLPLLCSNLRSLDSGPRSPLTQ